MARLVMPMCMRQELYSKNFEPGLLKSAVVEAVAQKGEVTKKAPTEDQIKQVLTAAAIAKPSPAPRGYSGSLAGCDQWNNWTARGRCFICKWCQYRRFCPWWLKFLVFQNHGYERRSRSRELHREMTFNADWRSFHQARCHHLPPSSMHSPTWLLKLLSGSNHSLRLQMLRGWLPYQSDSNG